MIDSIVLLPSQIAAALDGRSVRVRLPISPQPPPGARPWHVTPPGRWEWHRMSPWTPFEPPLAEGRVLWVREPWAVIDLAVGYERHGDPGDPSTSLAIFQHGASDFEEGLISEWRPAESMPRWASRLSLEVLTARIEQLQDISVADAEAEGVSLAQDGGWWTIDPTAGESLRGPTPLLAYFRYWDSTHQSPWDSNPWTQVATLRTTNG